MKRIFTLLVFAASISLAFSCNSSATQSQAEDNEIQEGLISKNVSALEFQQLINDNNEAIILDVRAPNELEQGVIGKVKHIDFYNDNFKEELGKLDRSKPVLIYCHSGGRSAIAMSHLHELGFSEVYNLQGGITEWSEAGLEIVK